MATAHVDRGRHVAEAVALDERILAEGAGLPRILHLDKVVDAVVVGGHADGRHALAHLGVAAQPEDGLHVAIEHLVAAGAHGLLVVDEPRPVVHLHDALAVAQGRIQGAGDVNDLVGLAVQLLLEVEIGVGRRVYHVRQHSGVGAFALEVAEAPRVLPGAIARTYGEAQALEHALAEEGLVLAQRRQERVEVGVRLEHQVQVGRDARRVLQHPVGALAVAVPIHVHLEGSIHHRVILRRWEGHNVVKDSAQIHIVRPLPDVLVGHGGGNRWLWDGDDAAGQVLVVRDGMAAQVGKYGAARPVHDHARIAHRVAGKGDLPLQ